MKIPLLSYFSGAGFLDLGFILQGGFDLVWHNELHRPFADAYEHGMSALGYSGKIGKIQNRSCIEKIRADDVLAEAFGGKRKCPPLFGLIGGPPCPDFSRAGKNGGGNGKNGRLTKVFVRHIQRLRPSFFLLENVPGLLQTSKHRKFLFSMLGEIQKMGYAVDLNILNALEYGVPQDRERLFVVGFDQRSTVMRGNISARRLAFRKSTNLVGMGKLRRNKILSDASHWFCWPKPIFPNAKNRFPWPKGAVNGNGTPSRPLKCPEKLMVHSIVCGKSAMLPNGSDRFNPRSNKFEQIKEGDVGRKSFKRLHRYRFSPNAAYGNNEVHLHPIENRRLSVREALMIQSVPNGYCFPENMNLTDKFKAVSNGVPVRLAEAMAGAIFCFVQGGQK